MRGRALLLGTLGMAAVLAANSSDSVPVMVELFTSEGCSSCPPADALLGSLQARGARGIPVIVLSEHVDYWDHLGWRDPFSSQTFSARQQGYGDRFQLPSVYTPQMVVDGFAEVNGSDSQAALDAIVNASRQPKAMVSIRAGHYDDAGRGSVSVRVEGMAAAKTNEADVILAITEDNLSTQVRDGENRGSLLRHTGVVRSLTRITTIEAKKGAYTADLQINIGKNWKRENLKAVVFVQDRKTKRIAGAASCTL